MKRKFVKCLALFAFVFLAHIAYSQSTKTIIGVASDQMGLPLPGVNVMVKGTTMGVITNDQGMFSIDVEAAEDKTLVFSFIGFESQEVEIGD